MWDDFRISAKTSRTESLARAPLMADGKAIGRDAQPPIDAGLKSNSGIRV
jgi:hypothetical protein